VSRRIDRLFSDLGELGFRSLSVMSHGSPDFAREVLAAGGTTNRHGNIAWAKIERGGLELVAFCSWHDLAQVHLDPFASVPAPEWDRSAA
jgi:hypothetical protein